MANATLRVSTTELARRFGDYLARVRFGGQTVVVLKNKTPVAELRALPGEGCTRSDFLDICANSQCDPTFADDIEKVDAADAPSRNPWT